MPPRWLTDELVFPPPQSATREGLVALGGDARPERLVLAYAQGIFPWPSAGAPLLWFSPNPRFVLRPREAHIGRSLRKRVRRADFDVRFDTAFRAVMEACAESPRPGQDGTWITPELLDGYTALHERGLAHSVEAWRGGRLVGGLYGVSLGRAFFGESMFAREPDASKVAFTVLLGHLIRWDFAFVDCQVHTEHLERFGAEDWPRARFLAALHEALGSATRMGPWSVELDGPGALALIGDAGD
jgi:leucyl/phenylalanyl-tRNA--protein transferase